MNAEVYETLPTSSVAIHMTAGAIAGIMEHCVMYPLDSVKTRMQALTPSSGGGGRGGVGTVLIRMVQQEGFLRPIRAAYGTAGCLATLLHDGIMNPAEVVKQRLQMYNSPYRNVITCITNIYRKEGIYAFYRSYTTQLAMNVPFQMIHFMTYEIAQVFTNPDHTYNPIAHMESGALAGAVAAAVTTPLDVCKTLLNTQSGVQVQGMMDAIKTIYRYGGLRGYFRGLNARVLYQMPATTICWSTYEFFKYVLHKKQGDGHRGPEVDNDYASGINQIQGTSRSSRFQDMSAYLNNNAPASVLLDVTTR
ncbi:mitoferrin-1 isoform X3 [Bombus fervidus]|uniref:mitoferrin-1 isoform X3 n=1 Tax=Bombus fervidus TaxID=203811 RepID=UPI003AB81C79